MKFKNKKYIGDRESVVLIATNIFISLIEWHFLERETNSDRNLKLLIGSVFWFEVFFYKFVMLAKGGRESR